MRHIIYLLGALFFSMTSFAQNAAPEEKILHAALQEYIDEMGLKYGLYCTGSGGKAQVKIETISLLLEAKRRVSLEEAREIHVAAQKRLLEIINNTPKLHPFLKSLPFSSQNVSLTIGYVNPMGTRYRDGSISSSGTAQGILYFEQSAIFQPRFNQVHEESYDQAVDIVQNYPLPYDIKYHKDVGYEDEIDTLCMDFAKKVHQKYGIECESFGGRFSSKIDEVAFSFSRKQSTSLQKARRYEVEMTTMLLDMINTNTKLRPYLSHYPFTAHHTPIYVECIHGQGVHFQDGSISRMKQEGGKISYYREKASSKHVLTHADADLVLVEDFDLAKKKATKKRGFFFNK